MSDLHVVILAAGKGTRMRSAKPKVLHPLAGRPLISHVLRTVAGLDAATTTIVIGHGAEDVRAALASENGIGFVVQSPQLGTGHALLKTEDVLRGRKGTVLLLYADVPLLQSNTLHRLLEKHHATHAAATVLTAEVADPYGYGRIVRDDAGRIARIVEERDASGEERAIREINSGNYAFALAPLFPALQNLAADNAQGEYYLTDLVAQYRQKDQRVETLCLETPDELRGVNSRVDLAELSAIVRALKNRALMLDGVTLEDPATAYVDDDVVIGADSTLGPNVLLQGQTTIGARCQIHAGVRLTNATIGDDVTILDRTVIVDSIVDAGAQVGPFAHVRPQSRIGAGGRVGNFVELKKATLGTHTKASHLSYLGDAVIGNDVNIGAGTIICNYDGVNKYQTVIQDGAFIGSDSQLIAPVTIGEGAYVATGSSITHDVPADALALSRGRQHNKEGWAAARRAKQKEQKKTEHG